VITAEEMIEACVGDVVVLLPRKQRHDVAQELRALLGEEIEAAAGAHESREAAARAVLTGFGRPADVAARYGTPITLIDPADTRQFVLLAVSGAALILLAGVSMRSCGGHHAAAGNCWCWRGGVCSSLDSPRRRGFAVGRRGPRGRRTAWFPMPSIGRAASRPSCSSPSARPFSPRRSGGSGS
jgi:hypothetical protein